MQGQVDMVMLVCAAFAALAFGVLLGYACCNGLFAMLRTHAPSRGQERPAETRIPSTIAS